MTRSDLVRRSTALAMITMGLSLVTALPAESKAPAPTASTRTHMAVPLSSTGPALPATGAFFGTNTPLNRMGTTTRTASRTAWELATGRAAAVVRTYHLWDDVFPNDYDYELRDLGQTPILSWGVSTNEVAVVTFADIAAGREDATINARAADVKAYGAPLFMIFDHEPEGIYGGTAAEFVDAWRHVHDRFEALGVTNVSWVLTLQAAHYKTDPEAWYPGDTYVDLLGADGYNWYGCPDRTDPWKSFEQVFVDFYDFGVATGKPMMIPEWGSSEDPLLPDRKAQWITDAATTLKGWPEVKAVSWYDNGYPIGCDWWIDTSWPSLLSFAAMGKDSYFSPPPPQVMLLSGPKALAASSSATFSFIANRAATFKCALDANTPVACTSPYTLTGLVDGDHTLTVTATDGPTGLSSSSSYLWTADTGAPVLTIAYGPPAFTKETTESLQLLSSDTDKTGSFTCSLDGAPMTACGTWIDYVGLKEGLHTFQAKAYDVAGNGSATVTVTWTVDTIAPSATIKTGPTVLSNVASPTFTFVSNEPNASFTCSKDLGAFLACTSPKTYSWVSNGPHTLDVRAIDQAGNSTISARWSWTTDTSAPTVTITAPANLKTTSSPIFGLAASESGAVLRCALDSGAATICSTSASYTNVALGAHTVSVYATDPAGNVGKTAVVPWQRLS